MRIALLVATLALSGCLSSADLVSPSGVPAAADASALPWGLADCAAAIAFVPVDAAAVAPHLPEGFRPLAPSEIGLPAPADAMGDATVSVELFSCGSATGLDANATDAAYGSVFVTVEPPAELADPDAGLSFVKFDVIVAEESLRAALVEAGVPAVDGEVSIDVLTPGAGTASGRIGESPYAIRVAYPPTPPAEMTLTFVEYTPVEGGFVTWKATGAGMSGNAVGVVDLAPGSLAAQIAGAGTAQAFVLLIEGGFTDASITLPA